MQKNYSLAWYNPLEKTNKKNTAMSVNNDASLIKRTLNKLSLLKNKIIVIKLSELIIENDELLTNFADNISTLHISGITILIVHEYEKIVDIKLQEISNINKNKYSHFRQDKLAKLVEMIISGRINRDIVTNLCSRSIQASGMSGKDNFSIVAKTSNARADSYRGKPVTINPEMLLINNSNNIVSIISPVACNEKGRTIILDANLTASMIAASIEADCLIMLEDDGYLVNNEITLNCLSEFNDLLSNTSELDHNMSEIVATKYALQNSGCVVRFLSAKTKDVLLLNLFD